MSLFFALSRVTHLFFQHSDHLANFFDGISDIAKGEQQLFAPTDEKAKNEKLATDFTSLGPFVAALDGALQALGTPAGLDIHELVLPDDVRAHAGAMSDER